MRERVPFQTLAQQMGTSMEIIERQYAHNKVEEWAVELASYLFVFYYRKAFSAFAFSTFDCVAFVPKL